MGGKIRLERGRARRVAVVNDESANAEIHQGKSDGAAGAAGTDLRNDRALCAAASKSLLEALAPPGAIKVVAGGAPIGCDGHCVDRADLSSLGVDGIEKRQDRLFEGIGDIGAGKTDGLDGFEKLRQPPFAQLVDIDQMIKAIQPG